MTFPTYSRRHLVLMSDRGGSYHLLKTSSSETACGRQGDRVIRLKIRDFWRKARSSGMCRVCAKRLGEVV